MSAGRQPPPNRPARVLIAGGGVAGLEAMIAVRTLAGARVDIELISPEPSFVWRSLGVAAAFGTIEAPPTVDLREIAQTLDARYVSDVVVGVNPATSSVILADGEPSSYDALIVCIGAHVQEAIPGAITFGAPGGTARLRKVLEHAERGEISRLVFAIPEHTGWQLALYELALLSAERLQSAGCAVEITLLTPESAPLSAFGGRASGAVLEELEDRGIRFVAGLQATEIAWGELRAQPGNARIQADAVITLPRLSGPALAGLAADERGFLQVDAHGLVRGTSNVYAAGDAVAFPIKHGGLATQQADAAAEMIAAGVGAPLTPAPFSPVLRGMLLTGAGPRYLEGTAGGAAGTGAASSRPLWWPPAKIAGRYLAPHVSWQVASPPSTESAVAVDVTLDPAMTTCSIAGATG